MSAALTTDFEAEHRAHPLALVRSTVSVLLALGFFLVVQGLQNIGKIMSMSFAGEDEGEFILLIAIVGFVILILLVTLAFSALSWKYTTWQLTEKGLRLRRGIVFKKDMTIPYERINAINTQSDLIFRILGLVVLTVDTAADDTLGNMKVNGMKRSDAELLRSEIFKRRQLTLAGESSSFNDALTTSETGESCISDPLIASALGVEVGQPVPQSLLERLGASNPVAHSGTGLPVAPGSIGDIATEDFAGSITDISESFRGVFAGQEVVEEPVEAEYTLSIRELVFAGLANASLAPIFIAIIGFVSQIPAFLMPSDDQWAFLQRFAFSNTTIVIVIALIVALVLWISSVAFSVLGFGGFRIRKRGRRLEVGHGLISQVQNMIDLNRVQYVSISHGFIMRKLGYSVIKVHTIRSVRVSDDDQPSDSGIIVHPFIKTDQVEGFIDRMIPDFSGYLSIPQEPIAPSAPRRAATRTFLFGWLTPLMILTIGHIVLTYYGIFPIAEFAPYSELFHWTVGILLALFLISSLVFSYIKGRNARVGHDDRRYALTTGALGRKTDLFERSKIQNLELKQNPFQRRLNIHTFEVTTATIDALNDLKLRDITQEQADELVEWSYSTIDNKEEAYAALAEAGLLTSQASGV